MNLASSKPTSSHKSKLKPQFAPRPVASVHFSHGIICPSPKLQVVQEVPEEQCTLEPQRECKQVTKLVPLLKPAEECVDIPKEVCVRQRKNPRRIQKPIVKKWCYTPTKESGLLPPPAPRYNFENNLQQWLAILWLPNKRLLLGVPSNSLLILVILFARFCIYC